ncbi:hypothetical protein [Methanocella sp. MCL-LM]|uniref:hypothetical protein n=1 Tax=Methanocella sp. MCL-LM TaxID=3412035 RepID=UPI003C77356E
MLIQIPLKKVGWKTYHGAFENYVFYNWGPIYPNDPKRNYAPGIHYERAVENEPTEYYHLDSPSDAEEGTKTMACISYLNWLYIQDRMQEDPDNWMTDPGVVESTNWLLEEQQKFSMGMIEYATSSDP